MTVRAFASRPFRALLIPGVAAALALSACGSSDSAGSADASEGAATPAEGIAVTGQWARTSPMSATAGAAYMTITSATDDALVGASVDATIAGDVQIHETTMVDPSELEDDSMSDDAMSDDSMDEESMDHESMSDDSSSDDSSSADSSTDMGVMQMREVGTIALPAGEAVALEPGGYHIMMLDLPAPLETGQTFEITLDFETADDMVVTVEVRDDAPAS
ncbi:MAG: copper chaperone PCu(A)C [Acidimicrobiales bacterium]